MAVDLLGKHLRSPAVYCRLFMSHSPPKQKTLIDSLLQEFIWASLLVVYCMSHSAAVIWCSHLLFIYISNIEIYIVTWIHITMSPHLKNVSYTKVEEKIFGNLYQIFKTVNYEQTFGFFVHITWHFMGIFDDFSVHLPIFFFVCV